MPTPEDIARIALRHALNDRFAVTRHAIRRMAEMGVTPKALADLVLRPDAEWQVKGGCRMTQSLNHPDFCAVIGPCPGGEAVVTVVFNERRPYQREGQGYKVLFDG